MNDEILDKDVYIQLLEQQVEELRKSQQAIYERNDHLLAWQWVVEHHRESTRFGGKKFNGDFAHAIKNTYGFTLLEAYPIVESALNTLKKVDNGGL